ncbi:MAG: outer membrane protein assembly factor BamD [Thiomargarita sp.]|nr:outer membrane protein assembly factor BamD [Thiomargarita sp.]
MKQFILYLLLLNLFGCTQFFTDPKDLNWSEERLYAEAKKSFKVGDYEMAVKYYEILETRYPFEKYAQQSQLDLMYAYYRHDEPELADEKANRFIKLYPRHPHVDYAYYMKGLVYFDTNASILINLFSLDRSQRDQGTATQSFLNFANLVNRFPNSKYTKDARQRMIYLRNMLATYELHVAQFYMQRNAYVAAINRAKTIIELYQQTPAVREALVILAKAYKIMELNDLATTTLKVLKLNYPGYKGIQEVENLVLK